MNIKQIAVVTVATALLAVAWCVPSADEAPLPLSPQQAPSQPVPVAVADAPLSRVVAPGAERHAGLQAQRLRYVSDAHQVVAGQTAYRLGILLECDLRRGPVREHGARRERDIELIVHALQVKCSDEGTRLAMERDLASSFAQGFSVAQDARGRGVAIRMGRAAPLPCCTIVADIVRALTSVADDPDGEQERVERACGASFEQVRMSLTRRSGDLGEVEVRRLGFVRARTPRAPSGAMTARVVWDHGERWPATLTSHDEQCWDLGDSVLTSRTELTLGATNALAVEVSAPVDPGNWIGLDCAELIAAQRRAAERDAVLADPRSASELARLLAAALGVDPGGREARALLQALAAKLEFDPAAVGQVGALLADGDLTTLAYERITEAVASAGTPECAGLLARLVADGSQDPERQQLLIKNCFAFEHASVELEGALLAVADEHGRERSVGDMALLAAGALMRHREGCAAVDLLIASQPDDEQRRSVWLLALGNTRDARAVQRFAEHLDHPSFAVRLAAVEALGQQSSAVVLPHLRAALGDPALAVRSRATLLLAAKTDDLQDPLLLAAIDAEEVRIRLELARGLGARDDGAGRDLLLRLVSGDPDAGVRDVARRGLERGV